MGDRKRKKRKLNSRERRRGDCRRAQRLIDCGISECKQLDMSDRTFAFGGVLLGLWELLNIMSGKKEISTPAQALQSGVAALLFFYGLKVLRTGRDEAATAVPAAATPAAKQRSR